MVASCSKLQCVTAAVRPDASQMARPSVPVTSVLKLPVSMSRSIVRSRLVRAASWSDSTLAYRSSGGRLAHSRWAVYAVTADIPSPCMASAPFYEPLGAPLWENSTPGGVEGWPGPATGVRTRCVGSTVFGTSPVDVRLRASGRLGRPTRARSLSCGLSAPRKNRFGIWGAHDDGFNVLAEVRFAGHPPDVGEERLDLG